MSTPDHPTDHTAEQDEAVASRTREGEHGRRPSTAGPAGRVDLTKHHHPTDPPADLGSPDLPPAVVEGELVPREAGPLTPAATTPSDGRPGSALVLRRAGATAARQTVHVITTARTVATHPRTTATARALVRQGWFPIAGAGVVWTRWRDAHGASRDERMMRAAETAGDREALLEWESRDTAEKAARHSRVMDWIRSPLDLIRAIGVGVLGVLGVLLLLGVVLAVGNGDVAQVIAPITTVIDTITALVWFFTVYGTTLLTLALVGGVAYLWQVGRARTEAPAWMAPTDDEPGGRDVIPDERAITNALRNLNLPPLNRKFREGWTPRWEMPPVHDGKGWHSRLLLPEGVPVEMIVNSKPTLAHNLLRLPVEVWPTEPRDRPGVMDLWVADPGSLTKPVAPWPLLKEGTADYFKGVPVGVDPRGNVVNGRMFQANWGTAGMMGSGKSTLIITALLGVILDPLVEVDVYCMAINADYDPLKPRLRTLFVSDDPDEIPTVLAALKQLMSELSERGRKLSAAGEPKLTRKLAEADPAMRPRVVVIDECQELFVSDVGDEAAELVEKIVAKARKYGVTLIFATPVPSADSLPRKVAKVLSNKACFAIGDHQGNDAILGTGKHRAGITATTLRAMTVDSDGTVDLGDLGTAMTSGFTPTDGLMRCFYVRRGDGIDEVTPVVTRALALRAEAGVTDQPAEPVEAPAVRDPLADIAAVLVGHKRLRTQQVLSLLAGICWDTYGNWTFTELAAALPDGAKPYKSSGVMVVATDRVTEALADRILTDHDDSHADTDSHGHGVADDGLD